MVSLDTVFDLLRSERRRYVVYYLKEQGKAVSIDELVDVIAEWENHPTIGTVDNATLEEIEISLQHNHLPKTAEVEFIEYNSEEGTIEIHGSPPEFDTVVTVAKLIEQPRHDRTRDPSVFTR